ncbi:MAG: hypothetical protein R3352_05315 [Salinisphaeraceae bacterium]|nr:hypothetical protein [Salinisphaeraceae bacterium]
MSTANTLKIISGAITVINGLISLTENSAKYRQMVANAIAEGRDVSEAELDSLESSAREAIARAGED